MDYLSENDKKVIEHIKNESEEYILNINENEYLDYILNKFRIYSPVFNFDDISAESIDKIPSENFSRSRIQRSRENETFFVYYIPFEGDGNLLKYRPNPCIMNTFEVNIKNDHLCFEIEYFNGNAEEINRTADSYISLIKKQHTSFLNQAENYNKELFRKIKVYFDSRKEKILKKKDTISSLNVPIRKKENLSETFTIPAPNLRKKISVKPDMTEKGYNPEPAIDNSTYFEILQLLNDAGKVFEKYPSTYVDKYEEELRDHLLFHLQPQFEGSVTGETFNKTGKTDILIKYHGENIFIAECKFWAGEKGYLDTISQLINYLTWRDSKSAILIFVRNKNISSVIEKVKKTTPEHSNFLGHIGDENESWFNYKFHINDDPNRQIKLAVLLFHIPDKD